MESTGRVRAPMTEPRQFQAAEHAARRRDRINAYRLMREALLEDPTFVPAWIGLSKLIDNPQQQRECLERALALDPQNKQAREALEQLRVKTLLAEISKVVTPPIPSPPSKVGEYLVEHGIISREQLDTALAEQRICRQRGELCMLGEILLCLGIVSPSTLAHALVEQQQTTSASPKGPYLRLGEYLLAEQLISPAQLEAALTEQFLQQQSGASVRLGEILLQMNYLTIEMLEQLLERQRTEFFSCFE